MVDAERELLHNASQETPISQGTFEDIDITTFGSLVYQDSVVILDVRTLTEVNAEAIEGAILLDFTNLSLRLYLAYLIKIAPI